MLTASAFLATAIIAVAQMSTQQMTDSSPYQQESGYSRGPVDSRFVEEVAQPEKNGSADGIEDTATLTAQDASATPRQDAVAAPSTEASGGRSGADQVSDPSAGLGQKQADTWCGWTAYSPQPPAGDPLWEGRDPSTGILRWQSCPVLFPGAPGSPGNFEGRRVVTQFFDNAAPAAPIVQVDPQVLAERAIRDLKVPAPDIHLGPDAAGIFVQIPTWLWIDDPGSLTASVSAGAVTVSATASLASTTWTLGEPKRNPSFTGFEPGPSVKVTCQGAGTPPPPGVDWKAEPQCGHTFRWRSLPERTGGTGKWPITATTSWNVTWQSNTGQSGTTTLTASSDDAVEVGEYRILLINGGR